MEIATLAGGCFWCTEAVFKKLKGVSEVLPGYTGGTVPNPTYWDVASDMTGHAESIQIQFDPKIIPYQRLLEVFFKLHDPTTLNRQGADVGSQYRSAIFYHSNEQKKMAEESKKQAQRMFKEPVVTEITPASEFYPAEEEHRNFYEQNKSPMYCRLVIDPKIQKLYQDFKEDLKDA